MPRAPTGCAPTSPPFRPPGRPARPNCVRTSRHSTRCPTRRPRAEEDLRRGPCGGVRRAGQRRRGARDGHAHGRRAKRVSRWPSRRCRAVRSRGQGRQGALPRQGAVQRRGHRTALPAMKVRSGARTARHSMDVWVSLRADEARSLGLELPEGVTAGSMIRSRERTRTGRSSTGGKVKRHGTGPGRRPVRTPSAICRSEPWGRAWRSASWTPLPLLSGIERLFATDPRLAGYLPAFGAGRAPR